MRGHRDKLAVLNELPEVSLDGMIQDIRDISRYHHSVTITIQAVESVENKLKDVTEKLDAVKKEQADIKVCPLCERPL
jgi:hypothetical protein